MKIKVKKRSIFLGIMSARAAVLSKDIIFVYSKQDYGNLVKIANDFNLNRLNWTVFNEDSLILFCHELVHIKQRNEWGWWKYYTTALRGIFTPGQRKDPVEKVAYQLQTLLADYTPMQLKIWFEDPKIILE